MKLLDQIRSKDALDDHNDLKYFTHSDEIGGAVLLQSRDDSSKYFIESDLIKQIFVNRKDLSQFVSGLYNNNPMKPNLRLFNFDLSISQP